MANGAVSFVAYSNFTVSIIDLYISEILQRWSKIKKNINKKKLFFYNIIDYK